MEQELSVSIIWGDSEKDAPSIEEVELLVADLEALLQEMQGFDVADDV